jgi:lipoprotein-anchoring transpeptidase ErfK/SrfK
MPSTLRRLRHWGRAATPSVPASTLPVLAAAVAVLVAVGTGPVGAAPNRGRVAVQPTQALAILLDSHTAMSAPDEGSSALELVRARRPITEVRTVLPVIGHELGADGVEWLRVLLPGRPNGHKGWIRLRATRAALTNWHIVVDTSSRGVTVYQHGRSVRTFKAIVGTPATPTPQGRFFVEEVLQLRAGDVGAPYALALSARSNVLQQFGGGLGQIGLHGLRNVGGVLGSAASHGCVRLDNAAMRWLVIRIGPGVPVTIKR